MQQNALAFDRSFSNLLCCFIHAEGLDDFITEWIIVATQRHPVTSTGHNSRAFDEWIWARSLYTSMIKSRIDWSPGRPVGSAISKFRSDLDVEKTEKALQIVGIAGAVTLLQKELFRSSTPPCDASLYKWFATYRLKQTPKAVHRYLHPEFCLFHPRNADPFPMLEYVREESRRGKRVHSHVKTPLEWAEKYLLRTLFLLRLEDKTSDAEWLEAFIREQFEPIWQKKDQWFYFTSCDPKLRRLKGKMNVPWIPKTQPRTISFARAYPNPHKQCFLDNATSAL